MEWAEKQRLGIGWEEVVESEDLQLRATLETIESSFYQNLDPDKKLFFLHLGLFKLGTTIKARRLLQTWISSGALGGSGDDQHYENYANNFSKQGIIEFKEKERGNCVRKNCQVVAILHKLSIKKMKEGNEGASHRVVHCSREKFNCSTNQDEGLICVFFNGGGCLDASPSYWKSFEQLRVLDLENFGLKFLPEAIGELIELRYLGLRNNYIQELPCSLGCLKNLEVFDIAFNFMVKVPDITREMDALVHLYMSDIVCMKPLKLEKLKNLKTLTYISVNNLKYKVRGHEMMSRLHKLGITEMHESKDVSKLFASLFSLESLVLKGSRFRSMPSLDRLDHLCHLQELILEGLVTKLPSPKNFPTSLRFLVLVNSCFDEDPMPILEKLYSLNYLKFQNAYTGQEMKISNNGFLFLRHLCIGELWHLRNLQVEQDALLTLRKLEIANCPYLQSLPKEITARKNLELNIMATKNTATKINKSDF